MPLDVGLTMAGPAFAGIAICWFLEGVEKERQARGDVIADRRAARQVLQEHAEWVRQFEAEYGRHARTKPSGATVVRAKRNISARG